jgi:bacterioferritin-associated ferredoxin
MIVCHCRVVSDRTVRATIAAGATTPAEVAVACGAGSGCGGCTPTIEALLAEAAVAFTDPARLARLQRERRAVAGAPALAPAV